MNSGNLKKDLIEQNSSGTLLEFLFSNIKYDTPLDDLIPLLTELHNSTEINLLDGEQWGKLELQPTHDFFVVQRAICKVLVALNASTDEMMFAVQKLVELGGNDGLANNPNTALVEWFRGNLNRAKSVIEKATHGDQLSLDHLTFALVADNYIETSIKLLDCQINIARLCAATSLGRMELAFDQIHVAIDALVAAIEKCDDEMYASNIFAAAFSICSKYENVSVSKLKQISNVSANFSSPNLQYQAALALSDNAHKLDASCVQSIISILKEVKPDHKGIIDNIDFATTKLLDAGYFELVVELIEHLAKNSSGEISVNQFDGFFRKVSQSEAEDLSKIAARWLTEGNKYVCAGFADAINEDTNINIRKKDLPTEPDEIAFMCRKTVGHFFLKPTVAASVLTSVIIHSTKEIGAIAADLLFDPLLLNYGGKIQRYLEEFCKQNKLPKSHLIQTTLDKKLSYLDQFSGIENLSELHPSEEHRHAYHVHWGDIMKASMKEAERKSVFLDLVSKSYLLYGKTSLSFIDDPSGNPRQIETKLGEHSTDFEIPRMNVYDPVGLEYQLFMFKHEGKSSK